MAGEIQCFPNQSGIASPYVIIISPVGTVWNGTTLAAVTNTNRNGGGVTVTEGGTTGIYTGDFPAGITTPGRYTVLLFDKAGGSFAVTDAYKGMGWLDWNGSGVSVPTVTDANGLVKLQPITHTGATIPTVSVCSSVTGIDATTLGNIKTQLVNALTTDTYAEPSGPIAATSSLKDKINFTFQAARNKMNTASTGITLRNDADAANVGAWPLSLSGGTLTRDKFQ